MSTGQEVPDRGSLVRPCVLLAFRQWLRGGSSPVAWTRGAFGAGSFPQRSNWSGRRGQTAPDQEGDGGIDRHCSVGTLAPGPDSQKIPGADKEHPQAQQFQ